MAKYQAKDYFEIKLSELKADRALTFNAFIHLKLNQHVILYKKPGDIFDPSQLEKMKKFGVGTIHIRNEDRAAWEAYLKGPEAKPVEGQELIGPGKDSKPVEEASLIGPNAGTGPKGEGDTLNYGQDKARAKGAKDDFSEEEENAASDEKTEKGEDALPPKPPEEHPNEQDAAQILTGLSSKDEQKVSNAREQGKEILEKIMDEHPSELTEALDLDLIADVSHDHSMMVAIYTVMFAIGMGCKDKNLLSDLTVAGLLHDVGISSGLPDVVQLPTKKRSPQLDAHFRKHVNLGLGILNDLGFKLSDRMKTLLSQHHEKFNGSGYPLGLESFKIDEYAQILGLADLLESIRRGLFDGKKYSLAEAVKVVDELEAQKNFPQYFNPETFRKAITWYKKNCDSDQMSKASDLVEETKRQVI